MADVTHQSKRSRFQMYYTQNKKIRQVTYATMVVGGRYSVPYMPEGIFDEIRDLVYSRDRLLSSITYLRIESRGVKYI